MDKPKIPVAEILLSERHSIKDALKKLDQTGLKVLLVVDKQQRLIGTITDGDVRRYILQSNRLESPIRKVYHKDPLFIIQHKFSPEIIRGLFITHKVELIPILDAKRRVVDYVVWNQVVADTENQIKKGVTLKIPVVIMAGGKSTRLEPFSRVIPKPLFPIGDKPIIECILDEFRAFGIDRFYISLNYKASMIKAYFDSNGARNYNIRFVHEKDFYGTAGGLKNVERFIKDDFIVSNSDVLVKADFVDVLTYHHEKRAMMTILTSLQHMSIPYGIVKFKAGGEATDIIEKPEYTFNVNAGVYVLHRDALKYVPKNKYFDMTDLIKILLKAKKKVSIYPINEKDYMDIGQWEEYGKTISRLKSLNTI